MLSTSLMSLATAALLFAAASAPMSAQQAADTKSTAQAKEVLSLMQTKKLEAFAARDPLRTDRFVAVLGVPGVQLLVVAADYDRPSDIEYRLYTKDYMGAYADLKSSILAKEKIYVEDMACDGLKPLPAKNQIGDTVVIGTEKRIFDGVFADPKKKNDKKISQEDYMKAFTTADERYSTILGHLLTELKK
jgi:hypothetical protein